MNECLTPDSSRFWPRDHYPSRCHSFHDVGKPKGGASEFAADLDHDLRLGLVNNFLNHPKVEHVLPGLGRHGIAPVS